ncbi:MAG: tetratricopeptide repeat protein [Sphingobacteriales bacterium]|nr:tetratricopeptide repeat protein [Sphingobacteriales bacterium]
MKKFILPVILFFGTILPAQPVKDLVTKGQSLLADEKFTEALDIFTKAWEADSLNYNVYTGRGTAYYNLKEFEKAFLDFSKAIKIQPDSALAYHYRANLMYALLYTDEAIVDNTRAIERSVNDTFLRGCFLNRGAARIQKRDFQGAYEDFSRAYSYDSTDIAIINNLGTVLDELGRREEAVEVLKKAIRLDSSFVGPYVNIGFQYTLMGKYRESLEYFDKALQLEKDEPLTLNNRGFARYNLKDYSGALEDINKSIELYPANAYAYKNRALVYLALQKKEEACKDLNKAVDLQFEKQYGPEVNELLKKNCK